MRSPFIKKMRNILPLLITPFLLCSCKAKESVTPEKRVIFNDYAAFLGRDDNNVTNFSSYKYISFEFDEFTDTNIKRISDKGTHCFAYLNAGSLESYRDYYEDFESISFKEYEDWPDEKWIDVSNSTWQDFVINTLAKGFKDRYAYGVYLDNLDVYSIAKEDNKDYSAFAIGLKNIIKGISDLGLKVMINGGAEFLDDMNTKEDNLFDSIWAYHQEEVFSLITNYEHNSFGKQNKEDREFYQNIATMMKQKGKEIFFLEYTTDNSLKQEISSYCESHEYHYYFASDIDLK